MIPNFNPSQALDSHTLSKFYEILKMPTNVLQNLYPYPNVAYQTMLQRVRDIKLTNFSIGGNQKEYTQDPSVKDEGEPLKIESLLEKQEPDVKVESSMSAPELNVKILDVPNKKIFPQGIKPINCNNQQNLSLRKEAENVLNFILSKMGKAEQSEINDFRNQYLDQPLLLQVYDKLVIKYFNAKKNKEDIVRYILRRAFKVITMSIVKKEKVGRKQAYLLLCKRCFQSKFDELEAGDEKNEEEILETLMPYKQKSQNKTMNSTFVVEIFSSEFFCNEYQQFLKDLNKILVEDNNKKKKKFLIFIVECVEKNSIGKIGSYNRLPWLDAWIEDTQNIAANLMSKKVNFSKKKSKDF